MSYKVGTKQQQKSLLELQICHFSYVLA